MKIDDKDILQHISPDLLKIVRYLKRNTDVKITFIEFTSDSIERYGGRIREIALTKISLANSRFEINIIEKT